MEFEEVQQQVLEPVVQRLGPPPPRPGGGPRPKPPAPAPAARADGPLPGPSALLALVREGRRLLAEAGEGAGPLACARCARASALDEAYCAGCGLRLRFPCPVCEATCRAGDAHCAACGGALGEDAVHARVAALEAEAEAARRRAETDPLRPYARTETLRSGDVRVVLGTLPDGRRELVKLAHTPRGRLLVQNERAALEALRGVPGVVPLLEVREDDERLALVLPHLVPSMLRFPVAIPRLLRLGARVLEVLEAVHARGLVHGDLKPRHVVLDPDDRPTLIDWNAAQPPGPSRFGAYTPLFAAPEQVSGDRVDARSDLYALGVVLYLYFVHDRLPAVLEEQAEPEPLLAVLNAKKAQNRAFLTQNTVFQGKLLDAQLAFNKAGGPAAGGGPPRQAASRGPGGDEAETRRILGAKYLFGAELRRTHDVNAEIHLTGEVLAVVRRATAVDPADRFPDATSMRAALERLLAGLPAPGAVTS